MIDDEILRVEMMREREGFFIIHSEEGIAEMEEDGVLDLGEDGRVRVRVSCRHCKKRR